MSEAYELLETLQEDVIAILRAAVDVSDGNIIAEQNGDLESEVERILGISKSGSGGKRGLALIVLLPEVSTAESNLPGPPLIVKQEIQVLEHVRINRGPAGTGLRSSHAAVLALNALHHHVLGSHALYAEDQPIQPLPARDGLISHVVTLFARMNGITGPGKPLGVTASMSQGEMPALTLACGTSGASIRYTTDGSYPSPAKTLYSVPITGLEAGTWCAPRLTRPGSTPATASNSTSPDEVKAEILKS